MATTAELEQLLRDGHGPLWSSPLLLTIKGKIWLNANNSNLYRYDRARLVREWRDNAYAAAASEPHIRTAVAARITREDMPALYERIHVVAFLQYSNKIRRDPANWYPTIKACVDGLVDARLVADDSTMYVEGPDIRKHPELSQIPTVHLLVYRLPGAEDSWEPRQP